MLGLFQADVMCTHPHSLSSRCLQVRGLGRPYDPSMRYPAPTFTGFTHQHSIFTSTRMCIQPFLPSLISCHSSYIVRFSCLCGSMSQYTNPEGISLLKPFLTPPLSVTQPYPYRHPQHTPHYDDVSINSSVTGKSLQRRFSGPGTCCPEPGAATLVLPPCGRFLRKGPRTL